MEFSFLTPQETTDQDLSGIMAEYTQSLYNVNNNNQDDIMSKYTNKHPDVKKDKVTELTGITADYTNMQHTFVSDASFKCNKTNKQMCDDAKLNEFPGLKRYKSKNCVFYQDSVISQNNCINI